MVFVFFFGGDYGPSVVISSISFDTSWAYFGISNVSLIIVFSV